MAQMGMDVEAVENVGRQLKQSAASVDTIVGTLDRTVSGLSSVWEGPDAQRFAQSWPTFRKSLLAAQASVAGLGQSALNNASEQREASAASGPGGSEKSILPGATHGGSNVAPPAAPATSSDAAARAAAFANWLPPMGTAFRIGAPTIECVGLVNDYAQKLFPGVPWSHTVGATPEAKDMYDAASSQYFDKIPAGEAPQPGDIVVVGANMYSSAGHVAVVETVNGNHPGLLVEQSGQTATSAARPTFEGRLSSQEDSAIIGYLRPKLGA